MEKPLDAHDGWAGTQGSIGTGQAIPGLSIARRSAHTFDPYQAEARLKKHFGVATLEGFGFEKMDASLCAAAVVIDYLSETQRGSLAHIVKVTLRQSSDFVCIDQATWRSLEIERTLRSGSTAGSLLAAIDRTRSPMVSVPETLAGRPAARRAHDRGSTGSHRHCCSRTYDASRTCAIDCAAWLISNDHQPPGGGAGVTARWQPGRLHDSFPCADR